MWRIRHVAACIALAAFAFNCDSGLLVPDTKLDLTINPLAFLGRALHMWDPQGLAGQVQNQAYGYLFPMGPFFALGKAMAIPMWAVQRLWWSALLCAGFMGVVTLARRMEIGTPASRMIAGLAFALSPHLLTVLGPVSAEALPACLAPWVMVPLVTAAREGSPRRAAMRSGIAVLLMGAINAALVLAALVPAALWLLTRRPDRRMRRLAGAWVLAVFLATAWWVGPLLLFGHYSAAFLGRIESATTTTGTATLVESMRGTSDWVAYLPTQGWHAGTLLLSQPAVVLNTVVVVALGLGGLAQRGVPHRNWLITCLLCGAVVVGIGYGGAVHGLLAGSVRDLLDGALAPLRNVHKFDVAIRLPLVLGLAHLVGRLRWGVNPAERRISRVVVLAVAAAAVAGAATPLIALRIAPAGSFADVPAYWRQAATWLSDQHAQGRSLLLPGSRFGQYLWGNPGDEPLQPLAGSTWDVRAAVPLSNAGHVRMLDAIDAQLAAGQSSAGLSAYLARSGVRYVVVRNDLDLNSADVPRPVLVHEALANSPGLSLVKSFGGLVGDAAKPGNIVDQHLQQPYPAVQIWTVSDAADPRVEAVPTDATVQVSGGPESLLPLSDHGLDPSEPVVLTGDSTAGYRPGAVVLTDGLRRREINNGASSLDTSATLTLDDPRRMSSRDRDFLPFAGNQHQSYARLIGAKAVSASSSASDPGSFGGSLHAAQPYSAFDGDQQTAWLSNPFSRGVGQWLQIDFASARTVDSLRAEFPALSTASRVEVRTDAGSATTAVSGSGPVALNVIAGRTRSLRLTVTAVTHPQGPFHQVGVTELSIPQVTVHRTIVMPQDLAPGTAVQSIDMTTPDDARNGCVLVGSRPRCAIGLARLGEESVGLDRTFTLPAPGSYDLSTTATPRAGGALDALLRSATQPSIVATASSQAIADPLAGPQAAVDSDVDTGWIASPDDRDPSLTLRWAKRHTISSLRLRIDPQLPATAPDRIVITSPAGRRTAQIGLDGSVKFAPLTTDRVTLKLSNAIDLQPNFDPVAHAVIRLGIGVSEVVVGGVPSTSRIATDTRVLRMPCGAGPDVSVDGVAYRTSVTTTVAALRELRPVALKTCAVSPIALGSGAHRVRAMSTATWTVSTTTLRSTQAAPPTDEAVTPQVRTWHSTSRAVAVGARQSSTLLVVHENANTGWHASLGGHTLTSITVDGWEQGYLLPAGAAGVVHLDYGPDRWYRTTLLVGLFAALLLLLGAAIRPRRNRPIGPGDAWPGGVGLCVAALAAALLLGGAVGAGVWAGVTAICLAAGAVSRSVPALRQAPAAIAAGCYLLAGAVLATRHWGDADYAAGWPLLQILCLGALVATACAGVRLPPVRRALLGPNEPPQRHGRLLDEPERDGAERNGAGHGQDEDGRRAAGEDVVAEEVHRPLEHDEVQQEDAVGALTEPAHGTVGEDGVGPPAVAEHGRPHDQHGEAEVEQVAGDGLDGRDVADGARTAHRRGDDEEQTERDHPA